MAGGDGDVTSRTDEVAAANRAFYAAFEARDLDAMAEVWERSGRATVTHPGWPALRGWPRVAASWEAIFHGTPYIQFFLTEEEVDVTGDVAWVTLTENILQAAGPPDDSGAGPLSNATVAAVNVFVRDAGRWRMVVHHGSPVGSSEESPGE